MKKTKKNAGTTLDADLAGYSATATATLAKKTRRQKLSRTCLGFGAATSAALLAGTGLEAAIVYSGLQNIVIAPVGTGNQDFTNISIDGGYFQFRNQNYGVETTSFFGYPRTINSAAFVQASYGCSLCEVATDGSNRVRKFSSGQLIGTSQSSLGPQARTAWFNSTPGGFTGAGFTSSTGFMGVQTANGNFGWIQVHAALDPNVLTIIDWAYDDSGAHIRAGDQGVVPEPALLGLGLLSLGAAGVRELRRRKREAAAVSDSTPTA